MQELAGCGVRFWNGLSGSGRREEGKGDVGIAAGDGVTGGVGEGAVEGENGSVRGDQEVGIEEDGGRDVESIGGADAAKAKGRTFELSRRLACRT